MQLEIGKYYKDRNGSLVAVVHLEELYKTLLRRLPRFERGFIVQDNTRPFYGYWVDKNHAGGNWQNYKPNGRAGSQEAWYDLVEEVNILNA